MSQPSSPTGGGSNNGRGTGGSQGGSTSGSALGTQSQASGAGTSTSTSMHWSLTSTINPSKFITLFGQLPYKLALDNYVSWMVATEATLDTINLADYICGKIMPQVEKDADYEAW